MKAKKTSGARSAAARPALKRATATKAAVKKSGERKSTRPAKALKPLALSLREILVPVDFSEHSRAALRYALALGDRFKARVVLVHIVEEVIYPGDWIYAPAPMTSFPEQRTSELVVRLREFAGAGGKKIVPVVRLGRPWQQVVEIAKRRRTDLIVTATHGHTGLKHALLGSVAEKIVRHAHCPVLSIRAE